jgi:hypothetical protein
LLAIGAFQSRNDLVFELNVEQLPMIMRPCSSCLR